MNCLNGLTAQSLVSAQGVGCVSGVGAGSLEAVTGCLSAPQVSLENSLALRTVSQGETRLETGELGGAYTKAAVKK